MRILSLLPAATEIVYLLGLEKYLVGVSHECDYPVEVKIKPKVTFSEISNKMSSKQIDSQVKQLIHRGPGVFHINKNKLKLLKPNLIITQEQCSVCAIPFTNVQKTARILDGKVKIISLEPESVEDILENILLLGKEVGKDGKAIEVVEGLKKRLTVIRKRLLRRFASRNDRKRVLVIEWLEPVMVAGHWVPEMVELAGGENLICKRGERSKILILNRIISINPDILIISPCGFDIQRTFQERFMIDDLRLKIGKTVKVYLVDGNSYMTRPGPRIVDGIEILSEIIHPAVGPRKYSKRDWIEIK